jgi:hypothetical protein
VARRVVIIGNGPIEAGLADSIGAADLVIRFNQPPHPPETAGSRTDILFLMNSGKSMQARLADRAFWEQPLLRDAGQVILPYHPSIIARYHPKPNLLSRLKGRKADWTRETTARLGAMGKPVYVLPAAFYEESCADLGIARSDLRKVFPSTGFLGIRYALQNFTAPEWMVEICGFGWTGWKRHDWERERKWVRQRLETAGL